MVKEKTFVVLVREVHIQPYQVRAESSREAVELVAHGGGEILEDSLEYSHTLDPGTWTVEEVE